MKTTKYPDVRRDESVIEKHHGKTVVADPYRWLEDPSSKETKNFVEQQTNLTSQFLRSCVQRNDIISHLVHRHNYTRYYCPFKHGDKYYHLVNFGLQNQSIVYVQDSIEAEAKVFLDPNTFSRDGTIALGYCKFSPDGTKLAYGLRYYGADWNAIHFRDVVSGEDYHDILPAVKCSPLEWTPDSSGLFYARYRNGHRFWDGTEVKMNIGQKLYYHKLRSNQRDDILVAEFPNYPLLKIEAIVSDEGKYIFLFPTRGKAGNMFYYSELPTEICGMLKLVPVIQKTIYIFTYITNRWDDTYFVTNKKASNFRIVKIRLDRPELEHWVTVLPENKRDVLVKVVPAYKDKIITLYVRDVNNVLQLRDLVTCQLIMTFPLGTGTIRQISSKPSEPEIFYKFTSFLTPGIIYRCDISKNPITQEVYRACVINDIKSELYDTEQKFYKSKDGTKIPMFLIYRKGMQRDGSNPCLLHGYGGFNVSLLPVFDEERITFLECFNGIVAIANIRGGGEYGEYWHNSGRVHNKQNTFDDFQAAAEYLIRKRYTESKKLVIHGSSNGGLLVGACLNQTPELFGAAIGRAGVYDMLRFHKFTTGYGWIPDYGNPDVKNDFESLLEFSPIHNVKVPKKPGVQYPATLIITGDHDDRVVPLHSYKFVATLQHVLGSCSKQTNPLLLQVTKDAGHGYAMSTERLVQQSADIFCFLALNLGFTFKSPVLESTRFSQCKSSSRT